MSHQIVLACQGCRSDQLGVVLDLGSSPPTCQMQTVSRHRASEVHYPLQLLRCDDCTLVQLSVIVDPAVVFPPDYPYSSGNSAELHRNFEDLADQFSVPPDDLVVDIGANDGTLLSKFGGDTHRRVAVEPTEQARKWGGPFYKQRFTERLARLIREDHGPATLITACNVLAHVDNLDDVMAGISHLLADDGLLVAENHSLRSVVDGQWDTVYHEHLRFFDPYSFWKVLERHGMAPHSCKGIGTHGGSFRMWARKLSNPSIIGDVLRLDRLRGEYDFWRLREQARTTRAALRDAVGRHDGEAVGIGATARATTVINYCGLDAEDLLWVGELAGSDKIGRYVPGTRIPVVDEGRLLEEHPPAAVLFSWHMADRIVPKLRGKGYQGDIVIPLPKVKFDDMADVA